MNHQHLIFSLVIIFSLLLPQIFITHFPEFSFPPSQQHNNTATPHSLFSSPFPLPASSSFSFLPSYKKNNNIPKSIPFFHKYPNSKQTSQINTITNLCLRNGAVMSVDFATGAVAKRLHSPAPVMVLAVIGTVVSQPALYVTVRLQSFVTNL